jgi:hypothetical protein
VPDGDASGADWSAAGWCAEAGACATEGELAVRTFAVGEFAPGPEEAVFVREFLGFCFPECRSTSVVG